MNESEFRSRLGFLTHTYPAEEWHTFIDVLRGEYPHTIELVEMPPEPDYNCFAYALGLHTSAIYLEIHEHTGIFADANFVRWLLNRGVLRDGGSRTDGVVLYFEFGALEHAGHFRSRRVRSKWGGGSIFDHGVLEVPAVYGTDTQLFLHPEINAVEKEFMKWIKSEVLCMKPSDD